jgi:hypothetical protein
MKFDYSYRIEDTKTMKIEKIKYKNIKIKLCLIVMYKKNYCFCIMFGYDEYDIIKYIKKTLLLIYIIVKLA